MRSEEIDADWNSEHVFLITKFRSRRYRHPHAEGVLRDSITWNDMWERDLYSGVLLPNMTLALKKKPKRAQGSEPGYGSLAHLE
jgi:hypothetical protein